MANIGVREAARILGVSHVALIKAHRAGSLQFEADGKIDLDRLLKSEWALNRGLGKPRAVGPAKKRAGAKRPAVAAEGEQVALTDADVDRLGAARDLPASALAKMPKIDLEKLLLIERREREYIRNEERRRSLIDRAGVDRAIEARSQAEKEALLNWPASVATEIAAELGVDERLVHRALNVKVRAFLGERSNKTSAA